MYHVDNYLALENLQYLWSNVALSQVASGWIICIFWLSVFCIYTNILNYFLL